jgi:hypothetical protein
MHPEVLSEPDWYPVDLDPAKRQLTWLHLPGEKFRDPFFEDTTRRHRRAPAITTPLKILGDVAGPHPRAIFFHASRCGSTLAMQLFGSVPGCRAISEPPVVDALLHLPDVEDVHLAGMARSFARPKDGQAVDLFLKLDSWHLPHLPRIRRVFPHTPCFFLYREPSAILRSHRRERGSQMVPGMMDSRRFGIDPATVYPADLDGYAERVLTSLFRQAAAAVEDKLIIPITYSQLPDLLWDQLGPALGLPKESWDQAKVRALQDAKHPHRPHAALASIRDPHCLSPALAADFELLESRRESLQQNFLAESLRPQTD